MLNKFVFDTNFQKYSFDSVVKYFQKTETKIMSLVSYWGAQTLTHISLVLGLIVSGNHFLALMVLILIAYHTYGVVGILNNII